MAERANLGDAAANVVVGIVGMLEDTKGERIAELESEVERLKAIYGLAADACASHRTIKRKLEGELGLLTSAVAVLEAEVERLEAELLRVRNQAASALVEKWGNEPPIEGDWRLLADELHAALLGCDAPRGDMRLDAAKTAALTSYAKMKGDGHD